MAESILTKQETLDELSDLFALARKSGYTHFDSLFTLAALVGAFKPKRVVELGTLHGCSTVFIAKALEPGASMVSIDNYAEQPDPNSVRRTLDRFRVSDRVQLIRESTYKAGNYAAGPVDMVFFDASHTDEGVLKEFYAIKPKLASGAVLIFDDALCIPAAIAQIGIDNAAMRAYSVNFGLCVMVLQ